MAEILIVDDNEPEKQLTLMTSVISEEFRETFEDTWRI